MPLTLPTPLSFDIPDNTTENADNLAKLSAQIKRNIDDLNEAFAHISNLPPLALYSTDIARDPNRTVCRKSLLPQKYLDLLSSVSINCRTHLNCLEQLVLTADMSDWKSLSEWEKRLCENTALLASLLCCLCAAPNQMDNAELAVLINAAAEILDKRFGVTTALPPLYITSFTA